MYVCNIPFIQETSVKVVNVSGNDIGAAGMSSIADSISSTQKDDESVIQELYVSGNLFGLEGARALSSLITTSKSLLVLDMKGCGIGLDGLIHITNSLTQEYDGKSCTLEVLNFEDILQPGVQQEQAVQA